jgi:type II secretory pathway component HofQ
LLNNGPSGVTTTYQANQQDITTELIVRPRINDDGTITMTLNPRVEDLGQVRVGPDGQEVPDILSQELQVATRVKNGETIVLGGLTRKSTQGRSTRYPVLGDLPLIGQFFRTTSTSRDDSELLIFVTARVLEDDSDLGFNP